jgi:hypothetical protein
LISKVTYTLLSRTPKRSRQRDFPAESVGGKDTNTSEGVSIETARRILEMEINAQVSWEALRNLLAINLHAG